jgi:hypothetical protein
MRAVGGSTASRKNAGHMHELVAIVAGTRDQVSARLLSRAKATANSVQVCSARMFKAEAHRNTCVACIDANLDMRQ